MMTLCWVAKCFLYFQTVDRTLSVTFSSFIILHYILNKFFLQKYFVNNEKCLSGPIFFFQPIKSAVK